MADLQFSEEQLRTMSERCGMRHTFDPEKQVMALERCGRVARAWFNGKGVRMSIPGRNNGLRGPYLRLPRGAALRYLRRALVVATAA